MRELSAIEKTKHFLDFNATSFSSAFCDLKIFSIISRGLSTRM